MHNVGNVIYHKFWHGDVSYRFNGKNINVNDHVRVYVFKLKAFYEKK